MMPFLIFSAIILLACADARLPRSAEARVHHPPVGQDWSPCHADPGECLQHRRASHHNPVHGCVWRHHSRRRQLAGLCVDLLISWHRGAGAAERRTGVVRQRHANAHTNRTPQPHAQVPQLPRQRQEHTFTLARHDGASRLQAAYARAAKNERPRLR